MNRIGTILLSCLLCASQVLSEEIATPAITDPVPAAEADGTHLKPGKKAWNAFDTGPFTMVFGGGFLIDYAAYSQDSNSKKQMGLSPEWGVRDFRLLLKGRFRDAPRLSYMIGYMYDGTIEAWRFRQTGIRVEVPEWDGNVFVGRTKEGFSTSKASTGYFGFFNERPTVSDAFLPIVADGVKWTGYKPGFLYNIGVYTNDFATHKESYYKNDDQAIVRTVWLPVRSKSENLLALAAEARYGTPMTGKFQYRSKPESFTADSWAIDTGLFPAKSSTMYGLETYYRPGPLTSGFEYFWNFVDSKETGNPMLHGGEIFVAYMLTGEVHGYDEKMGVFQMVSPKNPFSRSGGYGAFEVLLRYSYSDFDSKSIQGGKFSRITPMLNWYLNEVVRMEFTYGYSVLDRYDLRGRTQYFQTRLQMAFW